MRIYSRLYYSAVYTVKQPPQLQLHRKIKCFGRGGAIAAATNPINNVFSEWRHNNILGHLASFLHKELDSEYTVLVDLKGHECEYKKFPGFLVSNNHTIRSLPDLLLVPVSHHLNQQQEPRRRGDPKIPKVVLAELTTPLAENMKCKKGERVRKTPVLPF